MTRLSKHDFYLPYDPALVPRAKELRKNMTPAEKKLWYQYFRPLPIRILRQRPIDHFIVDFYCPSRKLVIEVDGETHFNSLAQDYDQARTQVLEGYGLQVVRFTNQQVIHGFESICTQLQHLIYPS